MKTHLVSQVILKQFVNNEGKLRVFNKLREDDKLLTPLEIAYVEIDDSIIEALERKWTQEVETHAPKTINILNNGDVLRYEKHIRMLKKILALHFIRSASLFVFLARSKNIYAQQIIDEVAAVYPGHRRMIEQRVKAEWSDKANSMIPAILMENINKVEDYLENYGLEIGLAPAGTDFVISDNPAITMNNDGRMGIMNGVPITEADSFAMPITPRHLITLKSNPDTLDYLKLTSKQVENANGKQIQHALFEYYMKPV